MLPSVSIGPERQSLPIDEIQATDIPPPPSPPISKIKSIGPVTLSYAQAYSGSRGMYSPPEYDLAEIGVIEDVDAYVSQAFQKKLGLMFKEGFSFIGSDRKFLQYYKDRMDQMAQASNIPTSELLRRISASLIRTSNAFLVKVRRDESSGGELRKTAEGTQLKPVAAYFPAAPETMRVDLDAQTGKINGWRQELPGGSRFKDFRKEDVIHFTINKREGFIFGTPTLTPVIDDIRALRQIEENIELLVHQHLFPLFHYTVGSETAPAGYTEDGRREIDVAKDEIRYMPAEGGIVTPERHTIEIVGAENKALRVETYVEHFKKRVIAGLGISAIDLGEGDTSNRATANTLSRALIDSVKSIQDALEAQWDQEVGKELMLESTFGEKALIAQNFPKLRFAEIDIENRIKQDEHALDLFKGYAITFQELRSMLSRDPIAIPEDPEDQDPKKYPEWYSTYWKLIEEPSLLIRAADEPYSIAGQALAKAKGSSTTQGDIGQASKERQKEKQAELDADKEAKIAVAKARPKPAVRKDSFLTQSYRDLEVDTLQRILANFESHQYLKEDHETHFAAWGEFMKSKFVALVQHEVTNGFNAQTHNKVHLASVIIQHGKQVVTNRVEHFIDRFVSSLFSTMSRRVRHEIESSTGEQTKLLEELHSSFASHTYRLDFALDMETRKAFNFGRVLGMKFNGVKVLTHSTKEEACDMCEEASHRTIDLSTIILDDIAPHHPGCVCNLVIHREE
jgi:hypothetical protein